MTLRISVLILLISVTHCARGTAQAVPSMPRGAAGALEAGFRTGDQKPLISFLEDWHRGLKAIGDDVLDKKPAFERAVYAVYASLYDQPKWAKKVPYRIVQDSVDVELFEGDLPTVFAEKVNGNRPKIVTISRMTIRDFRPPMGAAPEKMLYLDRQHLDVLLRFLTGTDKDLVDSNATEPNGTNDEVARPADRLQAARLAYLRNAVGVLPDMSGTGCGEFACSVYVLHISLNPGLDRAVVLYHESSSLTAALVQKDGASWRVTKRKGILVY